MKLHLPSRRRLARSGVIALSVGLLAYLGLSIFGAVAAMTIPRLPVQGSPADVGLSYQDVSFPSRVDDVLLKGWFIPGASKDVIIVVHGGFQNRVDEVVDTLPWRPVWSSAALACSDLRGRGESDGTGRSLSNIERDLGGAVDYVLGRGYTRDQIGLLGSAPGRPPPASSAARSTWAPWCWTAASPASGAWSITRRASGTSQAGW